MRRRIKPGSKPRLTHCVPAGKVIFASEAAALAAIPEIHAQRTKRRALADVARLECRAYRCPFSPDRHWHLSSREAA